MPTWPRLLLCIDFQLEIQCVLARFMVTSSPRNHATHFVVIKDRTHHGQNDHKLVAVVFCK